MNATFEFNQATVRIHFNGGVDGKGRFVRKIKTYKFINDDATPANMYTALTQLASLSSYPLIQLEKVVTENLHN